jgi:lysophospholipase L1-like esterase
MNPIFSRTFKALCSIAIVGLLSACGASSTVDPFKPTRVIGLGDGFNDATATVVDGTTTLTVVGQVAAYFGQSNIVSKASAGALVSGLAAQIDSVVTANGGFSSGDLVVITIGTFDVKAVTNATTAATNADAAALALVTQVQRLKSAGVEHILIMPVLELSRTPWGRANSFDPTATPAAAPSVSWTSTFNETVLLALSTAFGGQTPNTVIYANASGVTSQFLTATSLSTSYLTFTDTGFNGTTYTTPACGTTTLALNTAFATVGVSGCDASVPTAAGRPYTTMLFADGIHLTPAGNRWVAQFLYNATAQGWR